MGKKKKYFAMYFDSALEPVTLIMCVLHSNRWIPRRAYWRFLRWSEGSVFLFSFLQNLVTVSGGSPSPVVDTTITITGSL